MVRARPLAAPFAPILERQGFVLLDGGLATEFEARGHDLRDELWSARLLRDAPAEIRAVHGSYVAAGADCVTSATYQATLGPLGPEHFRLSVALAREAGADLVAASVGPYGATLADGSEFTGDYRPDIDLAAWPQPPGAPLNLFAYLGLVDKDFNAKPALAAWDAIFHRPRP